MRFQFVNSLPEFGDVVPPLFFVTGQVFGGLMLDSKRADHVANNWKGQI